MAADNKMLAQFDLTDIPPAPRGIPQVEVTFDIDANGIVNVSAMDKGTGKEQNVQIKSDGGLSDEDVDRMVKEAEANADADKERKEAVEVRNQAETALHSIEKSLKEHKDKVDASVADDIEAKMKTLKETLEDSSADTAQLKEQTEALTQASMALGEAIYKAQQAEASAENAGAEKKEDDNVVDASYTESADSDNDEDKKSA